MRSGSVALLLVVAVGCGADGKTLRDPVFDLPATTTVVPPTSQPETAPTSPPEPTAAPTDPGSDETEPVAEATGTPDATIVIDELFSPENATAEIAGRGATAGDPITVDGQPADVLTFDGDGSGGFVARVWIPDEGAHTVCVAATCGRVFTLAPDAESREEVVAKIAEAIAIVERDYDVTQRFADWTIEIGGALAGTGGSTDVDTRTIFVYRNRGRTVDDFVRTILHEFGHAADDDLLDDASRAEYLTIRGIDPKQPWREEGSHRLDDWAQQPAEDFAEVMVMLWSDGAWLPRTEALAPVPDDEQLAAVAALVAG